MRHHLLPLAGLLSSLATAQELINFDNGSVANADHINFNFSVLETKINSGSVRSFGEGPNTLAGVGSGALIQDWENCAENTAYGASSLGGLCAEGSTAIGFGALWTDPDVLLEGGVRSTAVGAYALGNMTLWSVDNTAVGYGVLSINESGSTVESFKWNTGIGSFALERTYGEANTGVGAYALWRNTSGTNNTALGVGSLETNSEGSVNTAIGRWAMYRNTIGNDNTALGAAALHENSEGERNTAIGRWAMYNNTTGSDNTALGAVALNESTESEANTAIGFAAMASNTTGYRNVAVGAGALADNTVGEHNTALGPVSLRRNSIGSDNTAVGRSALFENTVGSDNTAVGRWALLENTEGANNTAVGSYALQKFQTGTNNTALGFGADLYEDGLSNATVIGYMAVVDDSNKVRIGNAQVTVIEGQVPFTSSSDERLKESIEPISEGLDLINDLSPVSYKRKNDESGSVEMGLLAQDVESTLRKHGISDSGMIHQASEDGFMSLRYNDLFAPMIRAIQQLHAHNRLLEEKLEKQALEIVRLQTRAESRLEIVATREEKQVPVEPVPSSEANSLRKLAPHTGSHKTYGPSSLLSESSVTTHR